MAKIPTNARKMIASALAVLEWIAFLGSFSVDPMTGAGLQVVARVLP